MRVLGEEVVGNVGLYRRVGIMLEHDALYPFMTGRRFVELAAKLQGVTDPEAVDWAISTVNLQDAQGRPTGTYSRGMRQRIRLAATIVHDPEVLVLDEPLNGTDPRQRVEFAEFVERLRTAGRTVLISSHILEEVEAPGRPHPAGGERQTGGIRQPPRHPGEAGRAAISGAHHGIQSAGDGGGAGAAGVGGVRAAGGRRHRGDGRATWRTCSGMCRGWRGDTGSRLYRIEPLDDSLESVFSYVVQR